MQNIEKIETITQPLVAPLVIKGLNFPSVKILKKKQISKYHSNKNIWRIFGKWKRNLWCCLWSPSVKIIFDGIIITNLLSSFQTHIWWNDHNQCLFFHRDILKVPKIYIESSCFLALLSICMKLYHFGIKTWNSQLLLTIIVFWHCFYVEDSAAILCYIGISPGTVRTPLTKGTIIINLYHEKKRWHPLFYGGKTKVNMIISVFISCWLFIHNLT